MATISFVAEVALLSFPLKSSENYAMEENMQ